MQPFGRDWQANRQVVEALRSEALLGLYNQGSLPSLLAMAERVKQPDILGFVLGKLGVVTEEEALLTSTLASGNKAYQRCALGFVRGRFQVEGYNWVESCRFGDTFSAWSSEQQAQFFTALAFTSETWAYLENLQLEVQSLYWLSVIPSGSLAFEDCDRAIEKLIEYDRPYDAIELLFQCEMESIISTSTLTRLLEHTAQTTPSADIEWVSSGDKIAEILAILEASPESDHSQLAVLEWKFLPLFKHQERPPRLLHREISHNPGFFIEIVKWVYASDKEEQRATTDAARVRARLGRELLDSWNHLPGLKEDNTVDSDSLTAWINEARTLAKSCGRGKVSDYLIGRALTFTPKGEDGTWPNVGIREIIEEASSVDFEEGIEIGIYNSRGVVRKGMTEGGAQERQMAERYQGYSNLIRDGWPRTAALLQRIADSYESEARDADRKAELREDLWH